jgi:methyltransferase (TIGR00027 family)
MSIENVSDTARWVAVYRAMETARADAIFRDPYAERLAGEKGAQIVAGLKQGRAMAWALIVRTKVFDEIIMSRVAQGGVDTVLNLAAGLDTRPWRLPLPASLRWIDVDLPAMSEYKSTLMRNEKPVCHYEAIAVDLTDAAKREALFSQVGQAATKMLVITEGLLIYLTEDEVRSLARAIHSMPSAKWWLSDIASPQLLKWMGSSRGPGSPTNAPFKFGPADSAAFFAPLDWREIEYHGALDDARRLRREMKGRWFFRILGLFASPARRAAIKKMSGTILLERN